MAHPVRISLYFQLDKFDLSDECHRFPMRTTKAGCGLHGIKIRRKLAIFVFRGAAEIGEKAYLGLNWDTFLIVSFPTNSNLPLR